MASNILFWISSLIIKLISNGGYFAVGGLMFLDSLNIPVSSEIVMAFSGSLAFAGRFNLIAVIFIGALGDLIGSLVSFLIGFYGGRSLVERYGKYVLMPSDSLKRVEKWYLKYGQRTVFFCRILPLIRAFSSFPAGIARMDVKKFLTYTFAGGIIWSALLSFAGFKMAENWSEINVYFRKFEIVIGILIIIGIFLFIKKHIKK